MTPGSSACTGIAQLLPILITGSSPESEACGDERDAAAAQLGPATLVEREQVDAVEGRAVPLRAPPWMRGSSPMNARQVRLLPEPVSPTRPTQAEAGTLKVRR